MVSMSYVWITWYEVCSVLHDLFQISYSRLHVGHVLHGEVTGPVISCARRRQKPDTLVKAHKQ